MNRKRRALVLTDESARHPFRMSLPPRWRANTDATHRPILSGSDWRDVFSTYCAAFVAVSLFIS